MWAQAILQLVALVLVVVRGSVPSWYEPGTFGAVADAAFGEKVRDRIGPTGNAVAGVVASAALDVRDIVEGNDAQQSLGFESEPDYSYADAGPAEEDADGGEE